MDFRSNPEWETSNPELDKLLKEGFSYQHSWHQTAKRTGYVEYILFFNGVEVLRWESEMGMCNDMVAIIKKYISDKREQKLNELGI